MERSAMYWLRKLGIVRAGAVKGTYRSTKDMPDELFFDNVYDPQADLLHRSDLDALHAPAASPPPSAAAAWSPTHVVPAEGAWAWDRPDPSLQPVAPLDAGVPVRVDRREGGWAAITCSNGWQAWVDDRVLEELR